jgi:hypothetical protein
LCTALVRGGRKAVRSLRLALELRPRPNAPLGLKGMTAFLMPRVGYGPQAPFILPGLSNRGHEAD